MTTGSPDYGVSTTISNETPSDDILELAARLNSSMMINRTGQLMSYIADQICLSAGTWYVSNSNCYQMPSTKYMYNNRPTLKCITDANPNTFSGVLYNLAPISSNQIGVATIGICGSFACYLTTLLTYILNGKLYEAGIQIDMSNGKVYLYTTSQAWSMFFTSSIPNGGGAPIYYKFTFNLNTGNYGKLWFGSEQFQDLSSVPFYSASSALYDIILVQSYISNKSSTSNNMYFSDVQVTTNEVV